MTTRQHWAHVLFCSVSLLLPSASAFGNENGIGPDTPEPLEPYTIRAVTGETGLAYPAHTLTGVDRPLLLTGRSISVIDEEDLQSFGLDTVTDLARMVPGATVNNFYGLSGLPVTRGFLGAVHFNGIERAFNRSGFRPPLEVFEAVDFLRGPAPATFGAGLPGGIVNLRPKRPDPDLFFAEVALTAGSDSFRKGYLEANIPLELDWPSAIRVILSVEDDGVYYRGIDRESTLLYGSGKVHPRPWLRVFGGGMYYRMESEELIGWNRVTQELIDSGQYLTGQAVNDLTGPSVRLPDGTVVPNRTPGFVNRDALSQAVPFTLPSQASPEERQLYQFLGQLDNPGDRTVGLSRRVSLRSDRDRAEVDSYTGFFEAEAAPSPDHRFVHRFLFDGYDREKYSTYGYAEKIYNRTFETRLTHEREDDILHGSSSAIGASVRYVEARALVDFTVEPFSRRDLTQGPTPNDTIRVGPDRDLNGQPFWDPFGSFESETWFFGLFASGDVELSDRWLLAGSARWEHATWERGVPTGRGLFNEGPGPSGGKSYTTVGAGPVFRLTEHLSLFGTWQRGTTFEGYLLGGPVNRGDTNFQEMELFETGIKVDFPERGFFGGITVYHQELSDFDERGGAALPQRGRGVEAEARLQRNRNFAILGNFTWQQHWYRTDRLPSGFLPLSSEEMVQFGGGSFFAFDGGPNTGRVYGIPEYTANLLGRYQLDNGFGVAGGPSYASWTHANPQRTLKLPDYLLWNGSLFYRGDVWSVTLRVDNITDETYFFASESFSANTILLPQPGRQWFLTVARHF